MKSKSMVDFFFKKKGELNIKKTSSKKGISF